STGSLGAKEYTQVSDVTPGTYIVRVVNYSAVPGEPYTVTFDSYNVGGDKITPGHTEAWTMTCETPDGKVLESHDVTVLRGQQVTEDFGCGQSSGGGTGGGQQPGSSGDVLGTRHQGGSAAKRHKLSRRVACLRRANKIR